VLQSPATALSLCALRLLRSFPPIQGDETRAPRIDGDETEIASTSSADFGAKTYDMDANRETHDFATNTKVDATAVDMDSYGFATEIDDLATEMDALSDALSTKIDVFATGTNNAAESGGFGFATDTGAASQLDWFACEREDPAPEIDSASMARETEEFDFAPRNAAVTVTAATESGTLASETDETDVLANTLAAAAAVTVTATGAARAAALIAAKTKRRVMETQRRAVAVAESAKRNALLAQQRALHTSQAAMAAAAKTRLGALAAAAKTRQTTVRAAARTKQTAMHTRQAAMAVGSKTKESALRARQSALSLAAAAQRKAGAEYEERVISLVGGVSLVDVYFWIVSRRQASTLLCIELTRVYQKIYSYR